MCCRLLRLSLFLYCLIFFINSTGSFSAATGITSFAFTNETDKQALLAIKDQIPGDPFEVLSSWNNSLNFCSWKGVTCSHRHQRVTVLDLASLNLVGSLSPHIGNLTFLRSIYLDNNSFHGTIPQEIGRLFRLQDLSLNTNSFEGELPIDITRCLDLKVVNVNANKIGGKIPTEVGFLSNLQALSLRKNQFIGLIPPSLGNLSSLRTLQLSYNKLEGNIPFELGQLSKLEIFHLHSNNLSGMIPPPLYNISSMYSFSVAINQLHGNLPRDLGLTIPKLQEFYIADNKFSGPFPPSIANASSIVILDIPSNSFTGPVPMNLGNLPNLEHLNLVRNQFGTNNPNDLSFVNSLSNCTKLQLFLLTENGFGGMLPDSIANLSTTLTALRVDVNYVSGSIPQHIGNLVNLIGLALNQNMLRGSIPESIGKLTKLQGLYLYANNISGELPQSVGNMTRLSIVGLQQNMLEGSIPIGLANIANLQALDLGSNRLTGAIPEQIIGLSSLTFGLFLEQNHLTGPLPSQVGNLKNLGQLTLGGNNLTGEIPSSLGDCLVLEFLLIQDNFFEGTIPESFQQLRGIQFLDLSNNNLSGQIPSFLGELPAIQFLNLSHNVFDGEVPTEGVFRNISAFSIVENKELCGGIQALQLPACATKVLPVNQNKRFPQRMIPLVTVLPTVLLLACLSWILYQLRRYKPLTSSVSQSQNQYPKVSYAELLHATNGFSSTNLIGGGRYGSVYKAILNSGDEVVAIKVLNLQQHGANKSFLSECETLRNTRHRNLIKIITSCSSIDFKGCDFKALVFEFMPNGSLDSWLHPSSSVQQKTKRLNLIKRLNIAIDVASALDYLHHNCGSPIIHCDVKPSNVLLDDELCARVGDFGLARVLLATTGTSSHPQESSMGIRGTVGYTAPEYGMGGKVSTQGDVYSYGLLLLEMFTGKRPVDELFTDNLSLHNYVKKSLPDQVMQIVDPQIMLEEEDPFNETQANSKGYISEMEVSLASILRVGVLCSAEFPRGRLDIKDVVMELHLIRNVFLGIYFGSPIPCKKIKTEIKHNLHHNDVNPLHGIGTIRDH